MRFGILSLQVAVSFVHHLETYDLNRKHSWEHDCYFGLD